MEGLVIPALFILIIFLVVSAIQHNRRYDHAHYVLGVDMRGIEKVKTYKEKIAWIKSRPDFKAHHSATEVLMRWEQRDSVLDKIS